MHLSRSSRTFVSSFCANRQFHHLLIEFDCDVPSLESNIRETAHFRHLTVDAERDWIAECVARENELAAQYERLEGLEGPLISVNNSENPNVHSVTARGVQGSLQTSILGVLSSPVIRNQLLYFSRHGESDYNVLGRIGGDADLSKRGRSYAERLTKFLGAAPGVVPPKLVRIYSRVLGFSNYLRFLSIYRFGPQNYVALCIRFKTFPDHELPLRT